MSHLFIFGEQRTGSTLLHSILKNHPQIAATPNDLNILDLCSFKGIKLFPYNKDLNKLDQWNLGDLISFSKSIEGKPRELILKIVLDTFFKNKEEEIKVHKTPKAEHNLDIYREVFKNSLFIYLIRNPFAIISSKKYWKHVSRWKKLEGSNITFEKIRYTLKIIEKTLERIFKSIKIIDENYQSKDTLSVISYEEFVLNPKYYLKIIFNKLDIDSEESLLTEIIKVTNPYTSYYSFQKIEGIYLNSISQWKTSLLPLEIDLIRNAVMNNFKDYEFKNDQLEETIKGYLDV